MATGKIKAKDLSYDSSLPPFLQRLHAQHAGFGDGDRHERPAVRPKRVQTGDEDDGPTVVDESGETVTQEELEKLAGADSARDKKEKGAGLVQGAATGQPEASKGEAKRAESGVTDGLKEKKRKVAKVIGDGGEEDVQNKEEKSASAETPAVKNPVRKAKKARPVKLAFDDDEEA